MKKGLDAILKDIDDGIGGASAWDDLITRMDTERIAADAIDAPCLAAMAVEVASLRAKIPAGCIEVEAKKVGDADGYPIHEYIAEGIKLPISAIVVVGWASAILPIAMGAFKEKCICYTSREKIESEKMRIGDKQMKSAAEKQEAAKKLDDATATAKATGKKQIIRSWVTQDCMKGGEDCSFDAATEYVLPDGKKRIEYVCCF